MAPPTRAAVPAAYLRTTPLLQPCAHGIYFDHLQTYLLYHPDLRASGIVEEQQATEHYIKQGAVVLSDSSTWL
jgi:hypothetical protein